MADQTTLINDLVSLVEDPKMEVRRLALENLVPFSLDDAVGRPLLTKLVTLKRLLNVVVRREEDAPVVVAAVIILVNLSQEAKVQLALQRLTAAVAVVSDLVLDTSRPAVVRNHGLMLLANLTREDRGIDQLLQVDDDLSASDSDDDAADAVPDKVGKNFLAMVSAFFDRPDELTYMPVIMCNVATSAEGRSLISARSHKILPRLARWTAHPDVNVRRGAISTFKNCCFDQDEHDYLTSGDVNIVMALIRPLLDASYELREGEADEMAAWAVEHLKHKPTCEAEEDVRSLIVEALVLLTATKVGRKAVAEAAVYPVLREQHLVEENETIKDHIETVVNRVMLEGEPAPPVPGEEVAKLVGQGPGVYHTNQAASDETADISGLIDLASMADKTHEELDAIIAAKEASEAAPAK